MTCRKLQKADFGVFSAVLCADAPFDRLCTVAKYFAWVGDLYLSGWYRGLTSTVLHLG
jgi:hypothetical protein